MPHDSSKGAQKRAPLRAYRCAPLPEVMDAIFALPWRALHLDMSCVHFLKLSYCPIVMMDDLHDKFSFVFGELFLWITLMTCLLIILCNVFGSLLLLENLLETYFSEKLPHIKMLPFKTKMLCCRFILTHILKEITRTMRQQNRDSIIYLSW